MRYLRRYRYGTVQNGSRSECSSEPRSRKNAESLTPYGTVPYRNECSSEPRRRKNAEHYLSPIRYGRYRCPTLYLMVTKDCRLCRLVVDVVVVHLLVNILWLLPGVGTVGIFIQHNLLLGGVTDPQTFYVGSSDF